MDQPADRHDDPSPSALPLEPGFLEEPNDSVETVGDGSNEDVSAASNQEISFDPLAEAVDSDVEESDALSPTLDLLEPLDKAVGALPSPELLNAIADARSAIETKLDKLSAQFEREARAETTRERVVDRLHAELQEYKNDLLLRTLRPIFIELVQLHDDIGKMAGTAQDDQPLAASKVRSLLASVQQGIEDILYHQGVEPFAEEAQPGSTFDARRQRAVSTTPTNNPDLAKKVASRLRKGFLAGDKVIRPEIVSTYVFKAD